MKVKCNLGDNDHKMRDYKILKKGRKLGRRAVELIYQTSRKANFNKLRVSRISWDTSLKGKGDQDSWLYLKGTILMVHK